jgi:hypothetical protein
LHVTESKDVHNYTQIVHNSYISMYNFIFI